jgi:hypothetical protein
LPFLHKTTKIAILPFLCPFLFLNGPFCPFFILNKEAAAAANSTSPDWQQ